MSLDKELQAVKVAHLNLAGFSQVTPETAVNDVVTKMREEGHNICLIIEDGALLGLFTDRDVLRSVVAKPDNWGKPIREVMTPKPMTVALDSSAGDALWLMDDKHFRNMPVVNEKGKIVGTMTHSVVIEYLAARFPIEVLNRPPRPEQFPRHAEGG